MYNILTNWGISGMRILVGDELLVLSDADLDCMYVSEGEESVVYNYKNEALKIYKNSCEKLRLSLDDTLHLSGISTHRLLLPKRIIIDANSGEFLGYTTPFIKPATTTGIIRMKMSSFIDELDLLRSDTMMLAERYIEVEDFNLPNTVYDGGIYLVDPGSYRIRTSPNLMRFVRNVNSFNLNNYVKEEIFGMLNLTKNQKALVDTIFPDDDFIGDIIKETAVSDESVRQYVKRMTS